jgi:hypothetical protein
VVSRILTGHDTPHGILLGQERPNGEATEGERHGPGDTTVDVVAVVAVFVGAYAVHTVVHPCLEPPEGRRHLESVTRLRGDGRMHHPVGAPPRPTGRPPKGDRGSLLLNTISTGL